MNVVVQSLTVTLEQERAGQIRNLPVVVARMGNSDSKAFEMRMESWSSNVRMNA